MSTPETQRAPESKEVQDSEEVAVYASRKFDIQDVLSRTSLILIWVLVAAGFAVFESELFLQHGTFTTIFGSQYELVFLAVALIFTLTVGEFDLSFAASMGLAGTLVSLLSIQDGYPLVLAVILALAASTAVGAVNGFLVVKVGVDAIVATLGMGTFVVGVSLWATNVTAVSGLSQGFSRIVLNEFLGLPLGFWYGFALCLIVGYILNFTPLGRRMAFVGSSREVARLAGINVDRIRFGAYVAAGFTAGLGGILIAAAIGGYDATTSNNYLLPAFAAVFLGTAVIQPGRFNPLGSFVAVYFLQTGIVGLELAGLTGWVENLFYGGALVLAVSATTLIRRRTGK